MEAVHALSSGSFDGTLSSFQRDVHPEDCEKVWQAISTAIAQERPYRVMYRTSGDRGDHAPSDRAQMGGTVEPALAQGYRFAFAIPLTAEALKKER